LEHGVQDLHVEFGGCAQESVDEHGYEFKNVFKLIIWICECAFFLLNFKKFNL
jgi:hypothetical protein